MYMLCHVLHFYIISTCLTFRKIILLCQLVYFVSFTQNTIYFIDAKLATPIIVNKFNNDDFFQILNITESNISQYYDGNVSSNLSKILRYDFSTANFSITNLTKSTETASLGPYSVKVQNGSAQKVQNGSAQKVQNGSAQKVQNGSAETTRSSYRFCGVPDDLPRNLSMHNRVKRYSLEGSKWPTLSIKWAVVQNSNSRKISENEIILNLDQAFKLWSDVSKLQFIRVHPERTDIDISIGFYTEWHNDQYPFDGPGQTLAHAFYPGSGGDVHFDDSEDFLEHSKAIASDGEGTSFLVTAAHELGHALGLHHSNAPTALMAPYYQSYPKIFTLPEDDVNAIRSLYGTSDSSSRPVTYRPPRRTTTISTTTKRTIITPRATTRRRNHHIPTRPTTRYTTKHTPTTTIRPAKPFEGRRPSCVPKSTNLDIPDGCSTSFDAVTVFRREIFFFKDKYMWRVPKMSDNYPIEFDRLFKKTSDLSHVDAAYEEANTDTIVLFSGQMYYKITIAASGQFVEKGYLEDLGINATRVDAAMVWGHNGHVYIFSGNLYWRLEHNGRAGLDYPRNMGVWRGVPHNINAAVTVKTKTYFFSGRVYWPFDNLKMRVEGPPRLASSFWLDCPYHIERERQSCSSGSFKISCITLTISAFMIIIMLNYIN
uniref:Matrix metalloproteinase-2-like n=1 Tax=Hirondellea gigas TaxID=1518452 RepID=A0A6A7FZF8_9CRUS